MIGQRVRDRKRVHVSKTDHLKLSTDGRVNCDDRKVIQPLCGDGDVWYRYAHKNQSSMAPLKGEP